MKTFSLSPHQSKKTYDIVIASDIIDEISEYIDAQDYSHILICTDDNVESLYGARIGDALRKRISKESISVFSFPSGELHKSIETVVNMYRMLTERHADRQSLVINLGGGVVSDLGGFVAATYMRGIPFITIPTTLESMVDACIGGKTGVNFQGLKNYIGTITQPQKVVIDVAFLQTLPQRALVQGYAEVVKHGLIADARYFSAVAKKNLSQMNDEDLISVIQRSLEIKAEIIQKDPEEKKDRKLLNFGHTVGHAIESLSLKTKTPLYHGEAVSIGLVAESYLSHLCGYLSETDIGMIKDSLRNINLPVVCPVAYSPDELFSLLSTDKKNEKGVIKWTLLKKIGEGATDQVVDEVLIRKALQYIKP